MAQEEYQFDEASVQAIMHWTETAQLPKEIVLSESEHIYDTSLYVRANINDIKRHYPDAFYNPAMCVTYPGFRRDFFHLGLSFYKNSLKSRREFQKSSYLYSS